MKDRERKEWMKDKEERRDACDPKGRNLNVPLLPHNSSFTNRRICSNHSLDLIGWLENIRVFVHSPNNPLTHFFFLWNLWDYLAKPFPCQEVARATFWKWVRDGSCLLGKGNERQEARNYYAAPVHPFFFWGWTRQGAARQETSWCQIESATNRLSFLNQSLVLPQIGFER